MRSISNNALWGGRIISALPVLGLSFDSLGKLMKLAPVVEGAARLGYPEGVLVGIGIAELVGAVLYAVPRTSFVGAIVLTGFLGGAIATHVRIGDPFLAPIGVAALVWSGLVLRDGDLRRLLGAAMSARGKA